MKIFLLIIFMVLFTVNANLLLKLGVSSASTNQLQFVPILFNIKVLLGLFLFVCGAMCYLLLLRSIPLSIAQCFSTLQFAGTIIASRIVLGENITPIQWSGIGLIFLGIIVVSSAQQSNV